MKAPLFFACLLIASLVASSVAEVECVTEGCRIDSDATSETGQDLSEREDSVLWRIIEESATMTFIGNTRKKAEIGSLIFGYFSAIICILATLCIIGVYSYINSGAFRRHYLDFEHMSEGQTDQVFFYLALCAFVFLGGLFFSAIALTFSVYLIIGINKKNPSYVKAYLIYGIVVQVLYILGMLGACMLVHDLNNDCCIGFGLLAFGVCSIYSIILMMIHTAYKNMVSGAAYDKFENTPGQKVCDYPKV